MVIEAVKSMYKPTGRFILISFGCIWIKMTRKEAICTVP